MLPYHRLRLTFTPEADLRLPHYQGSAWRGLFGFCFKRIVCPFNRRKCADCPLYQQCWYIKLFESPANHDAFSNGSTHQPHPMILTPPLGTPLQVAAKEQFSSELVLLRPAFNALPYLLLTFQQMGMQGIGKAKIPFQLTHIHAEQQTDWQTIYEVEEGTLHPLPTPQEITIPQKLPTQFTLHTATPIHLKHYEKGMLREIDFVQLMTAILRRVRHLAQVYYEDDSLIDNHTYLLEAAKQVACHQMDLKVVRIPRYSTRQGQHMSLQGVTGSVQYEGDLTPFWPWLQLGSVLHIGNLTSFGFGKFFLEKGLD